MWYLHWLWVRCASVIHACALSELLSSSKLYVAVRVGTKCVTVAQAMALFVSKENIKMTEEGKSEKMTHSTTAQAFQRLQVTKKAHSLLLKNFTK